MIIIFKKVLAFFLHLIQLSIYLSTLESFTIMPIFKSKSNKILMINSKIMEKSKKISSKKMRLKAVQ